MLKFVEKEILEGKGDMEFKVWAVIDIESIWVSYDRVAQIWVVCFAVCMDTWAKG